MEDTYARLRSISWKISRVSRTRLLLVGKYEYLAGVLMRNGLKTCTTQDVLRTADCSLICVTVALQKCPIMSIIEECLLLLSEYEE